jgi:uncharacterized membrane protein (UPF0127 family)
MASRTGKKCTVVVVASRAGVDERVLCERCSVADGPVSRLKGLLGKRELPSGEGLLLRPASAVHTFFMSFAIDAVFLDKELEVVGVAAALRPWRGAGRRRARAVLELPAGEWSRRGGRIGDILRIADGHGQAQARP